MVTMLQFILQKLTAKSYLEISLKNGLMKVFQVILVLLLLNTLQTQMW